MPALETLGWDDAWNVAFEPFRTEELEPGRVAVPHRGAYDVLTRDGEVRARVAGRLRMSVEPSGLPVVGDWVALGEKGEIVGVLPRRTVFSRRAPHEPDSESVREQVVAANVDVVFVTFPLGSDLDPLLLERYVTLVLESGARPVILLTKADLEDDPDGVAGELADVGGEIPVHTVSSLDGDVLNASSVAVVDRHAPMLVWLEQAVQALSQSEGAKQQPVVVTEELLPEELRSGWREFVKGHVFWCPLQHPDETVLGAWWFERDFAWQENDIAIVHRLAGSYAYAWKALLKAGNIKAVVHHHADARS